MTSTRIQKHSEGEKDDGIDQSVVSVYNDE